MAWSAPPYIQQSSECACWAAALESWLKARSRWGPERIFRFPKNPEGLDSGTVNQTDLIAAFGQSDPQNAFVCNGSLTKVMQKAFAAVIAPYVNMTMIVPKEKYLLTPVVQNWLSNGHLYLVFQPATAHFAHVVVVYQIHGGSEEQGDETILSVMDPRPVDKGGGLTERRISAFDKCSFQVGWPSSWSGKFLDWAPDGRSMEPGTGSGP
jgi:Papain-like cysteine protease AvrRpt2